MMRFTTGILSLCTLLATSCSTADNATDNDVDSVEVTEAGNAPQDREANPYFAQYPKVIEDYHQFYGATRSAKEMDVVMQQRYRNDLKAMKDSVEATGAKFMLLLLSPSSGKGAPDAEWTSGMNFLAATARQMNIPVINMHSYLQNYTPTQLTLWPQDGHWSKDGAAIVAKELAKRLDPEVTKRDVKHYDKHPALLNDLDPNLDEVKGGEKNLPYHIATNAQGLRQKDAVVFPATKPRVIIIGDSETYCPFIDDEHTIGHQLQAAMPGKDVIMASNIGYTVDDFLSLYNQKAKYAEADVVVVATHPEDVLNYFFSQRNQMGRSYKQWAPTELEKKVYADMFGK